MATPRMTALVPPRFLASSHLAPSRSPSSTSASDADNAEEESADDSDLELLEGTPEAPHNPALATPKPSDDAVAPWPYTAQGQASPALPFPPVIPASSLPHEILLSILRLLPAPSLSPALLVCKAWCQCGVELLWHKPAFTNLPSLLRMLLVIAASQSPADRALALHSPIQADSDLSVDAGTTFAYPSFIRRLNFSSLADVMTDKILSKLLPCIYLERLTLASCVALSAPALTSIVGACERLVALDLSDVVGTDDVVLEQVARTCGRLQGLNLSGCVKVTDVGVEAVARGCVGLRRIKLRAVALITDTPIVLLSLLCPLLLEVDLVSCPLITSVSLYQLFLTSHHLRELSLAACGEVNDEAFPGGVEAVHVPESQVEAGALVLTSNGTTLQMPSPLRYNPKPKTFDHLRYLDLTSLALVTDDAIAGIVKFMPRIRNLILAKCIGLTDEAVLSICSLGKHLHYLHMGHVGGITDRAVTRLARSCTRLRYIDLACCNLLTDMSVFELATNLPRLKRIGLVRVTNLTDQAIYALFARPSLERIHLSYCENVTVQAIHDLLQHLPRLTHLSLTGVPAFRRTDLQTWCRTPPRDFNSHQRQSFCVYSGKGVQELRRYLRSIYAVPIEDMMDDTVDVARSGVVPRAPRSARHRDRTAQTGTAQDGAASNTVQPAAGHNVATGRHAQPTSTRTTRSAAAGTVPRTPVANGSRPETRQLHVPIQYVDRTSSPDEQGSGVASLSNTRGTASGSNGPTVAETGRPRAGTVTRGTYLRDVQMGDVGETEMEVEEDYSSGEEVDVEIGG